MQTAAKARRGAGPRRLNEGGQRRRRGELDAGLRRPRRAPVQPGAQAGTSVVPRPVAIADLVAVANPCAATGRQNQRRQEEEADRVEVGAPRRLDDQQRRPEVPDEDGSRVAARAASRSGAGEGRSPGRRRVQTSLAATMGPLARAPVPPPHANGPPSSATAPNRSWAERRVDGRDLGVVDLPVPGGAQRGEGLVAGWMGVGIDALREEVAVPEVAVDVVGELGRKRKEGERGPRMAMAQMRAMEVPVHSPVGPASAVCGAVQPGDRFPMRA